MPRTTTKLASDFKPLWYRLHKPGDTFTGLLLKQPVSRQATDRNGTPQTWDDGSPKQEFIFELLDVSSDHRDPDTCHWCQQRTSEDNYEGDTGARRFAASKAQNKIVQDALRASADKSGGVELYGPLTLTYARNDKVDGKVKRVYEASYRIPTDAEVDRVDLFLGLVAESPESSDDADLPDLMASFESSKASTGRKLSLTEANKIAAE